MFKKPILAIALSLTAFSGAAPSWAMDNSLYIALSRQTALQRQMAVIANNVANANTPGYKAQSTLYAAHSVKSPAFGEKMHKLDFTKDSATLTDVSEGPIEITGNPLDVAIHGPGYFKIRTPAGDRYTRAGNFTLNAQGQLVTPLGYSVLGQDNTPIAFQEEDKDVLIREDGTISVGAAQQIELDDRGQIGVFLVDNEQELQRTGDSLYSFDKNDRAADPTKYRISQGALEKSNVESVKEITSMIEISRLTGMTSKFLTDVNDLERGALRTINKQ